MLRFHQNFLCLLLLFTLQLAPMASIAAQDNQADESGSDITTVLKNTQKQLDSIKQQVSKTSTDNQLSKLQLSISEQLTGMNKLATDLRSTQEKLQGRLDILGPPPVPGSYAETTTVAQQRNELSNRAVLLAAMIKRTQAIKANMLDLDQQIDHLRQARFKTQLVLNTGSILSTRFWAPLIQPSNDDIQRLEQLNTALKMAWNASWQEEWRYGTFGLLLLVVIIWSWGRYFFESLLAWVSMRFLPDGRLRRSFMLMATVAVTLISAEITLNLLHQAFTRVQPIPIFLQDLTITFHRLAMFCVLISGLGRAALSLNRPSWRLVQLDDAVAVKLRYFPSLLAVLTLMFGTITLLNNEVNVSLGTIIFSNGLAVGVFDIMLLSIALYSQYTRLRLERQGQQIKQSSTLSGLIYIAVLACLLIILLSLLAGYISFASFLMYLMIWIVLVLMVFYFCMLFTTDLIGAVFSLQTVSGKTLKKLLNLKEHNLEQITIITTAVAKCTLLLLMILSFFSGSFGTTTPEMLLEKIITFLTDKGLKQFHIVPVNLLNALIILPLGIYVLRVTRRWLNNELLPKVISDIGIHTSLVALFSNVGYVLLILITLATLGIQWNRLAWMVSALSVGIGFGLQEIVKNFISGLILLTERPVKVGDIIGIGGVEGNVRRINVRATEIQLSDYSTMIVPNSQLISQNVRNATMGNAQGVVSIALTFSTEIDPEQVRNILLSVYNDHDNIMETPEPYVLFSQLGPDGIILSVTGYVPSPRMVGVTKSALLFNILKLLREQHVSMSNPQKVMVMKQQAKI
ncbi:DUF3772 domain-containing protein [Serratia rubidaea]|nr:DUF3772 domain-containing protein [Serratia rubidaea]